MSYSQPDEHNPDDLKLDYETFTAYIDTPSIPYLQDAVIDYNKDRFGGQLTFRAPNSKVPKLGEMRPRGTYQLRYTGNQSKSSGAWG